MLEMSDRLLRRDTVLDPAGRRAEDWHPGDRDCNRNQSVRTEQKSHTRMLLVDSGQLGLISQLGVI